MRKLYVALAILAFLSPLGIVLPWLFSSGSAWGEWSSEEVGEMVGFVPEQMERLEALWKAPIPDYSIPFFGGSLGGLSLGYIISALLGTILVAGLIYLLGKYLTRGGNHAP